MTRQIFLTFLMVALTAGCNAPVATAADTSVPATAAATTAPATDTPEPSLTASVTSTPTITDTPSITATATFAFPAVTVNKQAHCRYGPSVAFLHAADLYPGDVGTVRGRFDYSNWLYIKFDKLNYFCWVAPSVVDVSGDIATVRSSDDMHLDNVAYDKNGPPRNVTAVRSGGQVTITWQQVMMTPDHDRGYLIVAYVCQNGNYLWWTFSYPDQFTTSYTVKDEAGCSVPSEGVIYTVDKEGISKPATILWPAP